MTMDSTLLAARALSANCNQAKQHRNCNGDTSWPPPLACADTIADPGTRKDDSEIDRRRQPCSMANRGRRERLRLVVAAALISASTLPIASISAGDRSDIDRFIRTMAFDERRILSTHASDATQALPSRRDNGRSVTTCTATKRNASGETNNISILSPTAGTIYPGALVRINSSLVEGRPQALTTPRAPVTFRLDLPGQRDAGRSVEDPSFSNVQTSIDNAVIDWIEEQRTHGFTAPARQTLNTQRAYGREQVAASLGLNAQWMSNAFTANIGGGRQRETKTNIALFRQIYYSAIADLPRAPSAVFAPQVSLTSLREEIDSNNPPGFVRSVDYGRQLLIRVDSDSSVDDADIAATLQYASGGGASVNANLLSTYQRIAENSHFTVLAVGGNAKAAASINGMADLQSFIRSGARFGRSNPGVPISYTVTFLRDHAIAAMRFTADHTEWTCTERENESVRLRHDGAYIARFEIDWREYDESGAPVEKSWRSGSQTAGWTHTQNFPGDARGIRIRAYSNTGLGRSPWREAMNTELLRHTNRCFRITGTSLHPSFDNECR